MSQFTSIGGRNLQKIAGRGSEGKTYREILDLAKQGKIPISLEFYNSNRRAIVKEFSTCLPMVSDLHGSYAPQGATFKEANSGYAGRYEGYHVSEDLKTGERILFPLPKKLPDEKGNEVVVAQAKDSIIMLKLGIAGGKPTIEYSHDAAKNETLVILNTSDLTCVAFPTADGWHTLKGGIFVKSDSSDKNANYLYRANGRNWNGFFALGDYMNPYIFIYNWNVRADCRPSYPVGLLAKEGGFAAPKPEKEAQKQ